MRAWILCREKHQLTESFKQRSFLSPLANSHGKYVALTAGTECFLERPAQENELEMLSLSALWSAYWLCRGGRSGLFPWKNFNSAGVYRHLGHQGNNVKGAAYSPMDTLKIYFFKCKNYIYKYIWPGEDLRLVFVAARWVVGLCCGMQTLSYGTGSRFLTRGQTLLLEHRVLATGPPEKSLLWTLKVVGTVLSVGLGQTLRLILVLLQTGSVTVDEIFTLSGPQLLYLWNWDDYLFEQSCFKIYISSVWRESESHSVVSDSLQPMDNTVHGILQARILEQGFPCGLADKEYACNAGDLGSIPGLGRSPGKGYGIPLQYSRLENPHG